MMKILNYLSIFLYLSLLVTTSQIQEKDKKEMTKSKQKDQHPEFSKTNILETEIHEYIDGDKSPYNNPIKSQAIDDYLQELYKLIKNKDLLLTIKNTFKYTLENTIEYSAEEKDTFIITGDIHAMWLRDSTNQIQPYLSFIKEDNNLALMVKYLIARQIKCIDIDFYANAFNKENQGYNNLQDVSTQIKDGQLQDRTKDKRLFERKWEVDSIASHIKLITQYIKITKDYTVIETASLEKIMNELSKQQRGSYEDMQVNRKEYGYYVNTYTFSRKTDTSSETLQWSSGDPAKRTGMIRSNFRPSDDSQLYQYSIAGNYLLKHSLQELSSLLSLHTPNCLHTHNHTQCNTFQSLAQSMSLMATQIQQGLDDYSIMNQKGETYLAYEVDGYGSQLFMDDANIPSLLSLPYLSVIDKEDPLYKSTRKRLLSEENKYYFSGVDGEGIGGVHAGIDMIWPMSIIIQGLTSSSSIEVKHCLQQVLTTTANTFMIHESFNKDNQYQFTRPQFGWANSLFAEFIIFIHKYHPSIFNEI